MLRKVAFGMSFTYPCPRKLREIMKLSMIEREPVHQVESIWKEYHSARISNTSSVLSKQKYQFFCNRYPSPHPAPPAPLSSLSPSPARAGTSN